MWKKAAILAAQVTSDIQLTPDISRSEVCNKLMLFHNVCEKAHALNVSLINISNDIQLMAKDVIAESNHTSDTTTPFARDDSDMCLSDVPPLESVVVATKTNAPSPDAAQNFVQRGRPIAFATELTGDCFNLPLVDAHAIYTCKPLFVPVNCVLSTCVAIPIGRAIEG
jgi:hypothetical protein